MKRVILMLGLMGSVACGGAVAPFDDGGVSDGGGSDAQPDTNGPYPCGTTTCGTGEICVHPCCGGAPPPCVQSNDAGVCPQGYEKSTMCEFGPSNGDCAPPACVPDPPFCSPAGTNNECSEPANMSRDCYEACA